MISFILNFFNPKPAFKKEVGGFQLPNGIVIGPAYFSPNGLESTALVCPPIWAFLYSISNISNRLNKNKTVGREEFQSIFNSLLDDLIADVLIYLENRLRIILVGESLSRITCVNDCTRSYRKFANIDLQKLCDISFFVELDKARGKKHHTFRRYDSNYLIKGQSYGTMIALNNLLTKVRKDIQDLDNKLKVICPDYEVKIQNNATFIKVEWTAVSHAFDTTSKGKIVPKRKIVGFKPDPTNISYFSIQANRRR
jgi:hypothetical protein